MLDEINILGSTTTSCAIRHNPRPKRSSARRSPAAMSGLLCTWYSLDIQLATSVLRTESIESSCFEANSYGRSLGIAARLDLSLFGTCCNSLQLSVTSESLPKTSSYMFTSRLCNKTNFEDSQGHTQSLTSGPFATVASIDAAMGP